MRPLIVILFAMASGWSAEAPVAPDPKAPSPEAPAKPDPSAVEGTRKEADDLAAQGLTAMRDADADPKRGIDAAIAFSHALTKYQQIDDLDAMCEMQANIFWCKKRMNIDSLKEYVTKKGDSEQEAFARAQQIMTEKVPVAESKDYFDRALKYKSANSDRHFEIAIRFSEIVERFPDTEEATAAATIFAKEQSAYLGQVSTERKEEQAQLKAELAQARKSRFMLPPPVAIDSAMVIPDKTSLDQAIATVRKAYKDDYAKKKDSQKRALGRKLGLEAEKSKDDASLYYAMLDESARLAGDTEDYDQLLTSIEHLGQAFKGFDQAGRKRTELAKLKGKPTAVAILKLMDDPEDKAANGVVGRFFCFNLGSWELGLPLLSLGTDPDLHKAAEMELAVPKDAGERKATGDAWYEFGRKSATDKISAWTRAQWWYGQAQPNLAGVNKEMIQLRLDEIEKVLPQVVTDYLNISPKQWDRLKGVTVTVEARKGRSETNLSLQPGQRLRIVPQPTDTWQISYTTDVYGCTAKGVDPNGDAVIWRGMRTGKYRYGALVCQVGSGSVVLPGIVDGNGPLWLMPFTNGKDASLSSGTIRVKILKVSDDE